MKTTNTKAITLAAPSIGTLNAYIYWANQIPMLTAEEEFALAEQFQRDGDLNAARQLVMAHLRFVVRIARNYLGYGLPHADLIQEGTIGLMKAVKRFNPKMGVRLVSFAVHWIKAEIHEFVLRNWKIVKIATTKAQRKLFFNLRRATQKIGWLNDAEVEQVAKDLSVDPKEVRTMEMRMSGNDVVIDGFTEDGEDTNLGDPIHYLEAPNADPSVELENENFDERRTEHLADALAGLDERSRDILHQRWLADSKATLHELAAKYKISAERVRQIEQDAFGKIKGLLSAAAQ